MARADDSVSLRYSVVLHSSAVKTTPLYSMGYPIAYDNKFLVLLFFYISFNITNLMVLTFSSVLFIIYIYIIPLDVTDACTSIIISFLVSVDCDRVCIISARLPSRWSVHLYLI